MITAQDIILKAREYIGTPYHHQARLKGVGIDCVGLPICVAKELSLPWTDAIGYPPTPNGTLNSLLRSVLMVVPKEEARTGDLVSIWFHTPGVDHHVGILTDLGLLHTYATMRKVVEHGMDAFWKYRVVDVFRFPQVEVGERIDLSFNPRDLGLSSSLKEETARLSSGCCG